MPCPPSSKIAGRGAGQQILDAYRGVRDGLFRRIKQRFPLMGAVGFLRERRQ